MRTLLKNGKIYDGTGSDAFAGDILIEDEKIIAVGQTPDEKADEVIDLGGLSVSSGFFDAHSHNDCFPKFIRCSLRGEGDTMPRTIRKMTGAVADRFSIPDRGYIKPGFFADITVFDEAEMNDAVPDQEKAFGIKRVFINGHQVLAEGALDKDALKTSGHALPRRPVRLRRFRRPGLRIPPALHPHVQKRIRRFSIPSASRFIRFKHSVL